MLGAERGRRGTQSSEGKVKKESEGGGNLSLVRGCNCKSGGEPPHSKRDSGKRNRSRDEDMVAGVREGLTPEGVSYRDCYRGLATGWIGDAGGGEIKRAERRALRLEMRDQIKGAERWRLADPWVHEQPRIQRPGPR